MSIDKKAGYYDEGGIETLEIIKAKLTSVQYEGYLLGNVLKYSCRMMHKSEHIEGKRRDAEKASTYSTLLLDAMECK